ncbi:MAG TPA: enoyl-CoA hydratase-related protein [Polyangia bacterium]|nr:enoyl-CoA hydratase-related protein [Polyangia bacterium]
MSGDVEVARDEGVLRIAFNRPSKKNAITRAMYATITAALGEAEADPAIRVVLFTGGPEMFTAGNDLGDFLAAERDLSAATGFLAALARATKPMVAAVSGLAVGVGVTMLLHCDLTYVGRGASLSMPFLNLALVPEAGSTLLLPAAIGLAQATRLLYFGEKISGEEAARLGMVTEAVDDGQVQEHAATQARLLARRAPGAVVATRALLREPFAEAVREAIRRELEVFARQLDSAEAREAMIAVLEKRPPDFSKV